MRREFESSDKSTHRILMSFWPTTLHVLPHCYFHDVSCAEVAQAVRPGLTGLRGSSRAGRMRVLRRPAPCAELRHPPASGPRCPAVQCEIAGGAFRPAMVTAISPASSLQKPRNRFEILRGPGSEQMLDLEELPGLVMLAGHGNRFRTIFV